MAGPWEQYQDNSSVTLPAASYSKEAGLSNVVQIDPQSQAVQDNQDKAPSNLSELQDAINSAKTPWSRAALQQEHDRISAQPQPAVTADNSPKPWEKYAQPTDDPVKQALQDMSDYDSQLTHHPLSFAKGLGVSLVDMGAAAGRAAGDIALRGSGPLGRLQAKLIRPDLQPGAGGIMKDIQNDSNSINSMISPDTLNDPNFQAGRRFLGSPFETLGVNKAISKLPQAGQDIANVGLAVSPLLLGGMGKKGVAAKVEEPTVTPYEAAKAEAGVAQPEPPVPDTLYADSAGQVMQASDVEAARQARTDLMAQQEADRKANALQPLDRNPDDPMYVDSTGNAIPKDQIEAFQKAKADYETAQQKAQAGKQSEFNFEPPSKPVYEKPDTVFDPDNVATTDANVQSAKQVALDKAFPDMPGKDVIGDEYDKALEQRTQQQNALDPTATDVDAYQPPQQGAPTTPMKFRPKGQRGSGEIFNDLAKGVFKVGDMIKDVVGNMGRIIGDDPNGYRVKTEVPGGFIYSTVKKSDRIFHPADDVILSDGRTGTVRAVMGDNVKVSIKRGEGFDLETVPKSSVDLMDRSTRALGGVGKKGFGQGGAINLRNIFKGADPDIEPIKTEKVDIPYDKKSILDTLYQAWNRSNSVDEFRDHLEREAKTNSAFPNSALNDIYDWWNKFESGYKPRSAFADLSPLNQRDTADGRPHEQMLDETVIGKNKDGTPKTLKDYMPTEDDDIGNVIKEWAAPQFLASMKWDKLGSRIIKWAYTNIAKIRQESGILLEELMEYKKPFMELSRQEQLNVGDHIWGWDANPRWNKELLDKGIDWPTKDMLIEKGATPIEADAYLSKAQGLDKMFEYAGITKPKLPGYFHHSFTGAYKAYIKTPEAGIVKILPFSTKRMADFAVKVAKEELGATDSYTQKPSIPNRYNFVNQTLQLIRAVRNLGKAGESVADMLVKLQDRVMQGTITEALERKGIGGWDFEEGPKPEAGVWNKMLNRKYNDNLFNVYDEVMKDGVRAWKNRKIIDTVAKPFFESDKYDNMPNTANAVKDLISKGTGFSAQEYMLLDKVLRSGMVKLGFDPSIPSSVVGFLNSYIRFARTNSFNPIFAAEHILFQAYGMDDLFRMHSERIVAKESHGDFMGSMNDWMRSSLGKRALRPDELQALQWFSNRGGFKTNYYDLPNFKGPVGKVANAAGHGLLDIAIGKSKQMTFNMAYNYFKSIPDMPQQLALESAWNHTSKTMQSFDALDRPEVFQEGIVGKGIGPFNQIKTYNWARRLQSLQAVTNVFKQNQGQGLALAGSALAREGISAAVFASKSAVRLASIAVIAMVIDNVFSGGKGLPFHDDWDFIRDLMLKLGIGNPDKLGSYEEGMAWVGQHLHLPPWAIQKLVFGTVPTTTGADIRGTFSTNMIDAFSAAGVGAGVNLLWLSLIEAQKGLTGETNADTEAKLVRRLAPSGMFGDPRPGGVGIGIPWIEDAMSGPLNGNIPKPSKLDPTSPRTPEEDLFYKLSGKRPISESMRNQQVEMAQDMRKRDQAWGQLRTRLIVNKIIGYNTGSKTAQDLIEETMKANHGWSRDDIDREIASQIAERKIPNAIQFLEKAAAESNSDSMRKRFENIIQITSTLSSNGKFGQ